MNPNLSRLQPYPFEKLRALFEGIEPAKAYPPVSLHIGEPKHATPEPIMRALAASLDSLAQYPATAGTLALRQAICGWLSRRYALPGLDPLRQVLPVNGTREALFAIAQLLVDARRPGALVICPNPFYQIYEGAALLAGATPWFVNQTAANGFIGDYGAIPGEVWERVQLVYACSPANPSGRVMTVQDWKLLFEISDRYGFVIASDECYSEIYPEKAPAPVGALQAAQALGRGDFRRLIMFSSLSKRSNVPGMRSGFVAGDEKLLEAFLLYRTYQGGAMSPPVQAASIAAWNDELHVSENRRLYAEKFLVVTPMIGAPLATTLPEGGFYLWVRTPIDDTAFARDLYAAYNVSVLPGSFLARDAHGENPGRGYVRLALVAPLAECAEAVRRIAEFSGRL